MTRAAERLGQSAALRRVVADATVHSRCPLPGHGPPKVAMQHCNRQNRYVT